MTFPKTPARTLCFSSLRKVCPCHRMTVRTAHILYIRILHNSARTQKEAYEKHVSSYDDPPTVPVANQLNTNYTCFIVAHRLTFSTPSPFAVCYPIPFYAICQTANRKVSRHSIYIPPKCQASHPPIHPPNSHTHTMAWQFRAELCVC